MSNDYKIDIRNLNPDEIVANTGSNNVWVSAEVEEKIHFLSYTLEPQSPEPEIITVPAAVIKFSEPCLVSKPSGYASFQESMLMIMSVLGVAIPTKSGGPGGWDPSDGQTNSLISIPIVSGGSGYTQEGTTININPGTATAIAEIFAGGYPSGAITSIIVTDPGSGYLTVPSVTLNGDGVGAVLGPPSMGRIPKAICGVPSGDFSIFNLNVDNNAGNKFGFFPQYVPPTAAVIPLKSNIRTYGPYVSDNFATDFGGIDADTDNDLAPWVFGSLAAANAAGNSIANEFTTQPLKISEAGTVSTLGFPSLSFGQQLAGSGSYLNNINMTFGANGIKTTLDFQSFNPKFGSLSNIYRNQIKNNIKNKQKQLRFIRNQNIISQKINRGIKRITSNTSNNAAQSPLNQPARGASLQRCLVGEIYDWQTLKTIPNKRNVEGSGQRIVVGMDTLGDIVQEMRYDYEKKAYISLDGIYSPVSISGGNTIARTGSVGSGVLPRYIVPNTRGFVKHYASTIYPQPPFTSGECDTSSVSGHNINNIKIHNLYLNPLTNPTGIPYFTGTCAGHNIDLVGRETGIPPSGGLMNSLFPESSGRNKYSDDYRFLGMRGPLVLHSWGYDVDGKPIPNLIDSEDKAKSGIFIVENTQNPAKPSGLTEYFMQDWLQKPATWPVGPVDLRFDRERGVWVSPQPYKIVVARVTQNINAFGQGVGTIINEYESKQYGRDLYDGSGNPIGSSGCVASGVNGEEKCYDDWILTHMGQPECPDGEDTFDIVTCVELKKGGLYATRKRITIPGVSIVEDISSCIIAGTECEDQAGGDNAYYLAEACYSSTTPGYVYISYPDEEGNFSNGNVIQNNSSDSCYTITGLLNPGDSFPTNPVYEDGGAQGDWSLVNNCSTQSCLPDSFYYGERCDSENSIERIKITREGETTAFSNGDVLSNETYGCFTITLIVPEDLSPGSDATDLPHKSGGNISEWTEVSGCDYNSCSGPVYMENCCSTESPAYIKITEYDIKPEVGEIYKIESSNISSGCFKVITSEPCEYVVSEGGVQLTTQESCEVCLSGLQIDCEVESSGNGPLIKIVDRIGNSYNVNEYIYAYYDTYNSEYLVLSRGGDGGNGGNGGNITAFGAITKINSGFAWLSVEKVTGGDIDLIGRTIKVSNSAGYSILEGCTAKGFASKFISAS
jgi:hypothetical protein